ncbi:MAG: DegV family protein [Lachnospiraceae bacterium]|nr:DegV family protein [Lachnospiraceae bacterium]
MSKVAIVTDSNSGITQNQAKELGISVVPMPFMINNEMYYEDITLTRNEFFNRLQDNSVISTSQPSPDTVMQIWDALLKEHDEIVHIPMSSGLSGSYETAHMLSQDYDSKVHVVNNQRISVTQRQSVLDAIRLSASGENAASIKQILEQDKFNSSIYIMLDTLHYLKKGGRITPAAAALGTILKLKPVLQIQGEKLDAFAKARTVSQAKSIMITAIKKDMLERFEGIQPDKISLMIAHTQNDEAAESLKKELMEEFPDFPIHIDHLSLSVACHIGPGSLAIACTKNLN